MEKDYELVREEFNEHGFDIVYPSQIFGNTEIHFKDKNNYLYCLKYSAFRATIKKGFPLPFAKYNKYSIKNLNVWLKINKRDWIILSEEYCKQKAKIKFHCNNCNNDFEMQLTNLFSKGYGCPYCSHKIIYKDTSVLHAHPEIIGEFDFIKNKNIDFNIVSSYSQKKLWWKCKKCGNCWEAKICEKVQSLGKTGCPNCNVRSFSYKKSLQFLYPSSTKHWDYDKNKGIKPSDVFSKSGKKFFWKCDECGYKWIKDCDEFVKHGLKCPACSGNIISDKNRLTICRPDIAKDWDYTKNKTDVFNIYATSGIKYWWICKLGHSWESTVANRNKNDSSCPVCKESHGEKRITEFLNKYNCKYIPQYKFSDCKNKRRLPFDFAVFKNENIIIIEYHGLQHYNSLEYFGGEKSFCLQQLRDKIKLDYCKNNNIKMITIPYWEYKNIDTILSKEIM